MSITPRVRAGALTLAAVTLVLAVSVPGRRDNAPTTAARPTQSLPALTSRPTALSTAVPSPSARPLRTPTPPSPYVDIDNGFWLSNTAAYQSHYGAFVTSCSFDFCPVGVRVVTADPATGIAVPLQDETTTTIRGTTLDSLEASWLKRVPGARVAALVVDGQPGFIGYDKVFDLWGFVQFGGRLYGFDSFSIGGDTRHVLEQFVRGFHFMPPSCWLLPCLSKSDPSGAAVAMFDAAKAGGIWTEQPHSHDAPVEAGSARQWRFQCSDYCLGQLTLSIGTTGTGAAVPSGVSTDSMFGSFSASGTVRISGSTLEELEASWNRQLGRVSFAPITVDGVPAIANTGVSAPRTVLLVRGGYVLAFTSWGSINWDRAPDIPFNDFVRGFSFVR